MADFLVKYVPLPVPRPDIPVDRIYNPVTDMADIWSEHLVGTAWLSYPWTITKEKTMNLWNEIAELSNQFYGWVEPHVSTTYSSFSDWVFDNPLKILFLLGLLIGIYLMRRL